MKVKKLKDVSNENLNLFGYFVIGTVFEEQNEPTIVTPKVYKAVIEHDDKEFALFLLKFGFEYSSYLVVGDLNETCVLDTEELLRVIKVNLLKELAIEKLSDQINKLNWNPDLWSNPLTFAPNSLNINQVCSDPYSTTTWTTA